MRENRNYRTITFLTYVLEKIKKKKLEKEKKLENTITASFQANIGWKGLRKRENKNYCSVLFLPDH